jgi:hypothetical protein
MPTWSTGCRTSFPASSAAPATAPANRPVDAAASRTKRRRREAKEPVAICRLKRVAADYKDDIRDLLPPPAKKNGRRVACIGAGPASLTVARDLAPLGYEVRSSTATRSAGGMMRTQIPRFRLPEEVIDEETGYVLDLGVEFRGGQRIEVAEDCSPRATTRSSSVPARRAAATSTSPAARKPREHPHRHRLAGQRRFGHIDFDRQARDRARRRQHRDGLLPLGAPPRRRGRQGHRPLRLRGDEGQPLGKGRRDARRHPDPQLPGPQGLHHTAAGSPA